MTTITNLVVALMIVTSGYDPVKASEVHQSNDDPWCVQTFGTVETLYRKTCKTNFVYSTGIDIDKIKAPCVLERCKNVHRFTIDEIFGQRVNSIFFHYDYPILCEEDKNKLIVSDGWIVNGGAK